MADSGSTNHRWHGSLVGGGGRPRGRGSGAVFRGDHLHRRRPSVPGVRPPCAKSAGGVHHGYAWRRVLSAPAHALLVAAGAGGPWLDLAVRRLRVPVAPGRDCAGGAVGRGDDARAPRRPARGLPLLRVTSNAGSRLLVFGVDGSPRRCPRPRWSPRLSLATLALGQPAACRRLPLQGIRLDRPGPGGPRVPRARAAHLLGDGAEGGGTPVARGAGGVRVSHRGAGRVGRQWRSGGPVFTKADPDRARAGPDTGRRRRRRSAPGDGNRRGRMGGGAGCAGLPGASPRRHLGVVASVRRGSW